MKLCISCKRQLADDDTSCPFCGADLTAAAPASAAVPPLSSVQSEPAPTPVTQAPAAQTTPPAVPVQPAVAASGAAPLLPASRLQRFANYVADTICIYIMGFIVGVAAVLGHVQLLGFVISLFCSLIFYTFFEAVFGRTPGKFLTGTKVVMRDGSKPGFSTILLRSVIRLVPFEPLSILLFANPVGWHDGWSHTMVVPATYTPEDVRRVQVANKPAGWIIIVIVMVVVSIAVIGILSAIVLTSLNTAREKGRDARRVSDVKQIQLGLELYLDKNGNYPDSLSALVGADMLPSLPTDPATNQPYFYASCAGESYHVATALEFQGVPLESDADAPPQCAEDPIDGKDASGCVAGAAGFCFDEADSVADASIRQPVPSDPI